MNGLRDFQASSPRDARPSLARVTAVRSHAEIRAALVRAARERFAASGGWRPDPTSPSVDLGFGFLDAYALALHVLWTYQVAWANEGFLPTATLDASVDRLLAHLGVSPRPGVAAVALQHFRCRSGMSTTLPAGTAVRSPAKGDEPDVVFETVEPVRLHPDLNEMLAYLPVTDDEPGVAPPVFVESVLPPESTGEAAAATRTLAGAFDALRQGDEAAWKRARVLQDERRLADMLAGYAGHGGTAAGCQAAIAAVCKDLQAAKKAAATAPPGAHPLGLTQSQEMLLAQMRRMEATSPKVAALLDQALARAANETAEAHAARVGAMARFLDALVAGLVQDARDRTVMAFGAQALARVDAAGRRGSGGRAPVGCDTLYLLVPGKTPGAARPPSGLRHGDWLVVGEDTPQLLPDGRTSTVRSYREAVRVVRLAETVPPGRTGTHLRVTFKPPLRFPYELDRIVVLGNLARITEGATAERELLPEEGATRIELPERALTFVRDPRAPSGRTPAVRAFVGERELTRVEHLLDAGPDDAVFAVERAPGGGASLRVGDGRRGAALPAGTPLRVRLRAGLGTRGNRDALRIDGVVTAHPAVVSTFNPLPSAGGADPESAAHVRVRGPRVASAMDRAVSVDDVRALALAHDGIERARAFVEGTPRRRRVVVVVSGPAGAAPGAKDLADLQLHLAARVPPGVEVAVEARRTIAVRARLRLRLAAGADPITVVQRARVALGVIGEEGVPPGLLDPDNLGLGDDLSLSDVYRAVLAVPEVASAVVTALHVDGGSGLAHRIEAGPREMLAWAAPTVEQDAVVIEHEEVRS
ncbi:baseplate J/gp47 family protein [Sorangium sp. So ce341]|uniref:baseplate J/gp47 family protein n=1 Tax=Sorangium sp. So ce341 TaxID=3133302 RepID=UPI003F63D8D3